MYPLSLWSNNVLAVGEWLLICLTHRHKALLLIHRSKRCNSQLYFFDTEVLNIYLAIPRGPFYQGRHKKYTCLPWTLWIISYLLQGSLLFWQNVAIWMLNIMQNICLFKFFEMARLQTIRIKHHASLFSSDKAQGSTTFEVY